MKQRVIYARSDDIICLIGAGNDQSVYTYDEQCRVKIDDWVFEVVYNNDAEWKISVIEKPVDEQYRHHPVGNDIIDHDYSEVIVFYTNQEAELEIL